VAVNVVFGGLEVGSRGCDGALQRHGWLILCPELVGGGCWRVLEHTVRRGVAARRGARRLN
jgi:hypothetical protein